jgi:hypothetical protein
MKNMETVIKPMTKEYLKNYPKNRELYRVVNLISNGVINKASGRTYAYTDSCLESAFKFCIPFEEEWVHQTMNGLMYQSQSQLTVVEYQDLIFKLTNDANEKPKMRQQFIDDLIAELQSAFPDSKINCVEKIYFPRGYTYNEVKKMFIEIDWS